MSRPRTFEGRKCSMPPSRCTDCTYGTSHVNAHIRTMIIKRSIQLTLPEDRIKIHTSVMGGCCLRRADLVNLLCALREVIAVREYLFTKSSYAKTMRQFPLRLEVIREHLVRTTTNLTKSYTTISSPTFHFSVTFSMTANKTLCRKMLKVVTGPRSVQDMLKEGCKWEDYPLW
jgi:hypothetical protein